jgi:hypothetical protein
VRLPRPHIPLSVRVETARRQFAKKWGKRESDCYLFAGIKPKYELKALLHFLFDDQPYHLDHDPPLAVRKKIHNARGEIIGYDPAANDPDFLIYRKAVDHRIKTYTRGEGAQYPDRVLIKKIRRIEHPKPKRKYNWPKRKVRP